MTRPPLVCAINIAPLYQKLTKCLCRTSITPIDEYEVISYVMETGLWHGEHHQVGGGLITIFDFTSHDGTRAAPTKEDAEIVNEGIRIAIAGLKDALIPYPDAINMIDRRITRDTLYIVI